MERPMSPPLSDSEQDRTERAATQIQTDAPGHDHAAGLNQRLGDFVLERELGRGGFARVYLARQVSLERRVALKLSRHPSRGEAQTLAGLEHDHIVKVYAEFSDPESGNHGLVLQYVPGTSLADVLGFLYPSHDTGTRPPPERGADILKAIDELSRGEAEFDPAALRDRELLTRSDYATSVCRLGARLAEALAFAHSRGILHCDIKPGNILLNRYGRPMLVDFNVAMPMRSQADAEAYLLGGTSLYMSPEQLAAFAHLPGGDVRQVDHRTDLYSLSLVLLEMLLGKLPYRRPPTRNQVSLLYQWKCQPPDHWMEEANPVPTLIWRVLRRGLDPDPAKRHADGTELAEALRHAADLVQARRSLPRASLLAGLVWRRPITVLLSLVLVPHLVGSVVNIVYNQTQIPLTREQEAVFPLLVAGYNSVAWPVCVFLGWIALRPLILALRRPRTRAALADAELDFLRRRALNLGNWAVALALLGWLPGGVVFPLVLHLTTGDAAGWTLYAHFLLSFTLSGLIALVYCYFGAQYVIVRGLYFRLVHANQSPSEIREEQNGMVRWIVLFQVLGALVPLIGAILLIVFVGELSLVFRLLVVALIVAGMLGLGVAVWVAQSLRAVIAAMQAAPLRSGDY